MAEERKLKQPLAHPEWREAYVTDGRCPQCGGKLGAESKCKECGFDAWPESLDYEC